MWVTKQMVNTMQEDPSKHKKQLYAATLPEKKVIQFQLHCGASCNVILIGLVNPDIWVEETNQLLTMYNHATLKPVGKCKIKLKNARNKKKYRLDFVATNDETAVPFLGSKAA